MDSLETVEKKLAESNALMGKVNDKSDLCEKLHLVSGIMTIIFCISAIFFFNMWIGLCAVACFLLRWYFGKLLKKYEKESYSLNYNSELFRTREIYHYYMIMTGESELCVNEELGIDDRPFMDFMEWKMKTEDRIGGDV